MDDLGFGHILVAIILEKNDSIILIIKIFL